MGFKIQYVDNFKMTVKDSKIKLQLKDKKLYAFGDSIVAGHKYEKASFINFVSSKEGMDLSKYAVMVLQSWTLAMMEDRFFHR